MIYEISSIVIIVNIISVHFSINQVPSKLGKLRFKYHRRHLQYFHGLFFWEAMDTAGKKIKDSKGFEEKAGNLWMPQHE